MCTRAPEQHADKFDATYHLECDELGQAISLRMKGVAIRPSLHIKPDVLYFGECPVNERRDIVVSLHNGHRSSSLDWSIPRVPHLHVEPSSGNLAPQQRADVVVTYLPKQLGHFQAQLTLYHCHGLYSLPLDCFGEAPVIAEKALAVKGLEKTGRDFEPEYQYVKPQSMQLGIPHRRNLQKLTKIMKSSLWEDSNASLALDSIMLDLPNPTPYSLSPSAMQDHVRNKQKYNLMLRQQRFRRKMLERYGTEGPPPVDIFHEGDVDIGMRPWHGLRSPRLCVDDIPPEKLWLQRQVDDDSTTHGVTGIRFIHDENRFVKKKFKAAPTTQAEVHDGSVKLEIWQLQLISTGPKILDFGTIYVKSVVTKSFTVFNDLPQAILVAMQYDAEELARSTPVSQLIPSAQVAGFDITLCSATPQSFSRQVSYTLNGHHSFKFLCKAEITPVQLQLSRTDLTFRFGDDNLERTISESIVVANNGNGPARFQWISSVPSHFGLSTTEGVVRPGQSMTLEVTFKPPNSGERVEGYLTLKIEDGRDQTVRCVGQTQEASCNFGLRRVDFGVMAVGLPADKSVPVINNGNANAVFHVDAAPDGVTVTPARGRISTDGRADLNVHVQIDRPVVLDSVIVISVWGGRPIKLPITATAVVPSIEIPQAELDFGALTLGAVSTLPLRFSNSSAVEGTLYVNLMPYQEFTLALSDEPRENPEDAETDAQCVQTLTLEQYQQALGLDRDAPINTAPEEEDDDAQVPIFMITVPPGHTVQMQLTYQPQDLGTQYFEFPVTPAGGEKPMELRRVVHAEALRPRLLFSTTTADFKNKVVSSGQSAPSVLEIALHNADEFPLEWVLDTEPLRKLLGVFHVDPSRGVLAPEQDCLVRAAFLPSEPTNYNAQLPVYISPPRGEGEGEDDAALPADMERAYLYFRLKGTGTVPKLSFDRREVGLPVVPLNIRARSLFYLHNEGYESLEVKYRLPADIGRIPLSIHFPEGQLMGITKTKIPVELYFQSNKAMSFSAKIEFLDSDGGAYAIPVSGTTDNSVLTTFPYLMSCADFFVLEGHPVIMLRETQEPSGENAERAPSFRTASQSISSLSGQDFQFDFITRWLNANVLKSTVENFPADLITQNGRQVYEMVECLAAKSIPKVKADAPGPSRGSKNPEMIRIGHATEQYEEMLNFFKHRGALLSNILPEHFLSRDHYVKYMVNRYPFISKRRCERQHAQKSAEAWLHTIYQCIRIFLLNRVTPKLFKNLPGMQDEKPPEGADEEPKGKNVALQAALDAKGLADSNIYSVAEMILLRWVNYHYTKQVQVSSGKYPERVVQSFDADFQDGLVFALLILSHCPTCRSLTMLKHPCNSPELVEQNASSVVAALQEIGLHFPLTVQDIVQPVAKDILLLVLFLFQNLPHYVPKTTIVFATQLNQPLMKHIELTNPSKKQPITYYCKLEGSSDFSMKADTIVLEPRQTASFPLEFASRFTRPVHAQVVFTSRRQGNAHAAAMVFKLKSQCTGRKPLKTFKVPAPLYEVGALEVDVDNPFPEDAEFLVSISSQHVEIVGEERKPVPSKLLEQVEPFYATSNRIRLRASSSTKLTIQFMPLETGTFVGSLGFFDGRVGEFYYEVVGEATNPTPLEVHKVQCKVEEMQTKDIVLPFRNAQFEKAKQWLESGARAGSVPLGRLKQLPESITYDVRVTSPFYQAPKQITISQLQATGPGAAASSAAPSGPGKKAGGAKAAEKKDAAAAATADLNTEKLALEFRPREPGVYPCSVILTSAIDMRIYSIEGTGTAPNSRVALTFNTHARREVVQNIPIVNPTDKDWPIKATFKQEGLAFDGPREFTAKKRSANGQATTSHYPLTFRPEWICDVKAHLQLDNIPSKESYEYELHGVAEEPLSVDHRVVQCEARVKTTVYFDVQNYFPNQVTFDVESDLMHICGAPTVTVEGKGVEQYEFGLQPLQAGVVTGCVMFKDPGSGQYTWYTIELHVSPPKPQQQLTLNSVVRQAVAMDIELV